MGLKTEHLTPYLPYGLKARYNNKDYKVRAIDGKGRLMLETEPMRVTFMNNKYAKPTLRPLSSITKEEAYDLLSIVVFDCKKGRGDIEQLTLEVNGVNVDIKCVFKERVCCDTEFSLYIRGDSIIHTHTVNGEEEPLMFGYNVYGYLFSKHFDVFGLIEQGLAIEG